jgi:uncharacterized protein with PIN domain
LGYCHVYRDAERPAPRRRERLLQCERCVQTMGRKLAARVTTEEMHALHAQHGGCPVCGHQLWADAGWKLVPVQQPGG